MPNKVWDEITYPFPNISGAAVEVWEWISYLSRTPLPLYRYDDIFVLKDPPVLQHLI